MQICLNCQSQQFEGTIFCGECGASLLPTGRRETTVSLGKRDLTGDLLSFSNQLSASTKPHDNARIVFVVVQTGRRIELNVLDEILIGRADKERGIFPDIDLGPDDGYDQGVSRRHAILSYVNGTYLIEDLNSANGTFINGRQIASRKLTAISNGDELACGKLRLQISVS